MIERFEHFSTAFWAATGTAVAGGFVWLVRTIFTNQKALNQLQVEIKTRNEHREVEKLAMDEMRADIREVRDDVKQLYARSTIYKE